MSDEARDEGTTLSELAERLGRWCEAQPEYPYLFLHDRARRKRAADLIAKRLMVLPVVAAKDYNRANVRKGRKSLNGKVGKVKRTIHARVRRQMAKSERDRQRFARLSQERQQVLAERAFDGEQFQDADASFYGAGFEYEEDAE